MTRVEEETACIVDEVSCIETPLSHMLFVCL